MTSKARAIRIEPKKYNEEDTNFQFDDITWSEVLENMYNDVKSITEPVGKLLENVTEDPNIQDKHDASNILETYKNNANVKKFKLNNPDIITFIDENKSNPIILPRNRNQELKKHDENIMHSKRSLIRHPNIETYDNKDRHFDEKDTPSTMIEISNSDNDTENATDIDANYMNNQIIKLEKNDKNFKKLIKVSKSISTDIKKSHLDDEITNELDFKKATLKDARNTFVNNYTKIIENTIQNIHKEALNLYNKEELANITKFIKKTSSLEYEGPLEKKNPWSWGYKLRWVKIIDLKMKYYLSPEDCLNNGNPLGVLDFKLANWTIPQNDEEDKFFLKSKGSNRIYEWKIPKRSIQQKKSWIIRLEKILKATAFIKQLNGIIDFNC